MHPARIFMGDSGSMLIGLETAGTSPGAGAGAAGAVSLAIAGMQAAPLEEANQTLAMLLLFWQVQDQSSSR
ncbi:hypothetical protein ACWDA9_38710 [Streptomyces sp. NPDC001193]